MPRGFANPSPAWSRFADAAAAKLALYLAWSESGLTKVAFAQRPGVAETEVRRMLDPYHATRIERLEAALHELGRRLVVSVEAA